MSKPIPLQDRKLNEFLAIAFGGWLLAFNSGMINSTTTLLPKSFSVCPMTGAATSIGMGLGSGNPFQFGQSLGIIVSHIFGGSISGYLVPNRTFYLGTDYGRIFKAGSIVLAAAAITNILAPGSLLIYFFAAMSSGIQNALTSRYSGNILRTTHISGSVSDIGLTCGRLDKANLWKLYIHLGIVICFICGGILASYTFKSLNHKQLFVNCCLYSLIGILYTLFVKPEREYRWIWSLLEALPIFKTHHPESSEQSNNLPDEHAIEITVQDSQSVNKSAEIITIQNTEDDNGLIDVPINVKELITSRGRIEIPGDIKEAKPSPTHDYSQVQSGDSISQQEAQTQTSTPDHTSTPACTTPSTTPTSTTPTPALAPTPAPALKPLNSNPWTYSYTQIGIVLLCLHSGFLNATTKLSSRQMYTTHITGAGTQFSIAIINNDLTQIGVNGATLLLYFLGSVLTGTVVKSDFYAINKSYVRIFIIGTLLLILALLIHLHFPDSYSFYFILSIFSGMQASLGCKIKGVIIRTTFMSGCATDIGASLGKMLKHGVKAGLSSIKMLLPSLLAYISGACFATLLYPVFGNYQVIVNIVAFASIGCLHSYILHFRME